MAAVETEQSLQAAVVRRRHHVLMVGRSHPQQFLTWFRLSGAGVAVLSAESGEDAANLLAMITRRAGAPDLVVVDARMDAHEAVDAAEGIRAYGYRGPMLGLVPIRFEPELRRRLVRVCDTYTSSTARAGADA